jgi:Holliday junction DNA helicase RuvB
LALFDSSKMPAVEGGRYKSSKVLRAGRRDLLARQAMAIKAEYSRDGAGMSSGAGREPKMEQPSRRIVTGAALDEDARIDASVRPQRFADYIGQSRVKENIEIAIQAARSRGEALDHVLLYGPPGLGKTTLAQIIASELGVTIKTSSGPLLERKGDLTAILTSLEQREVFFLDEIHRLVPAIEEVLYPAMEDYRIDLVIGQGAGARIHPFILNRFTLIGATTRAGLVTAPLRSRFGIVHRLEFYTSEDLATIIRRSASILGIAVDDDGAFELARRSRGTPRVANRLLRRARDFAQVRAQGHITLAVAKEALQMLGVDEHGLDEVDRTLMLTILQKYAGGPVGLSTLAASISEEEDAIEEIYEPYLMQLGLLDRTQRGRVATALAYKLFGLESPRRQPGLF